MKNLEAIIEEKWDVLIQLMEESQTPPVDQVAIKKDMERWVNKKHLRNWTN